MAGDGRSRAKLVVAIDFGTTFSGFSYAKQSEPDNVMTHMDWPYTAKAGSRPYCKTQTSLYYVRVDANLDFQLQSWGWKGLVEYRDAMRQRDLQRRLRPTGETNDGKSSTQLMIDLMKPSTSSAVHDGVQQSERHYVSHFKLLLAESLPLEVSEQPPPGLSAERMVEDFLREMSKFALQSLQRTYGKKMGMKDIQWCVTVPAIWDEGAKLVMKKCAEKAGMVNHTDHADPRADVSPYPLHIVLEPEAASVYCQHKLRKSQSIVLRAGDKIMIADIGGGTIDIVVHQKADDDPRSVHVEEVVPSYGSLGGGTFVDTNFYDFMRSKIGCFDEFCRKRPTFANKLHKWWLEVKMEFPGDEYPAVDLDDLPQELTKEWQMYDKQRGCVAEDRYAYTEMRLECSDLKAIFDPEVNKVLQLIDRHVRNVRVLMVVGGFSASPYLRKRIEDTFSQIEELHEVIIPEEPGAAVSAGAVQLHMADDPIRSRIAKRTFGIGTTRTAIAGDPEELLFTDDENRRMCGSVFSEFVRNGDTVPVNARFRKPFTPVYHNQKLLSFKLYSSPDRFPRYTTAAEAKLEGEFTVKMKRKWYEKRRDKEREVEVSMEFGAATINVTARRSNFGNTKSTAGELLVEFSRLTT